MSRNHYIGMDVHCRSSEMAVVTSSGRLTRRHRCATTIPELVKAVESVRRPRLLAFEEGPLAGWLFRNLHQHVDGITVCDPRRNSLIVKESDKDDPIDAEKLAQLFRGGYLKAVHHTASLQRTVFKQHVGTYHDRVRQRVREANRIIAEFRHYGLIVKEVHFVQPSDREALLVRLPDHAVLRENQRLLWRSYDVVAEQVLQMRALLATLAEKEQVIRRFKELPGMGWVRSATFFVYVDTPWRFKSKQALWKYLGIGLERWHSGQGPMRVRVVRSYNRTLKGMILGAAQKAIGLRDNPFADQYRTWIEGGLSPCNSRRNVARSLASTLWGMWKSGSKYRPELVRRG